jgi:hypothetical protein
MTQILSNLKPHCRPDGRRYLTLPEAETRISGTRYVQSFSRCAKLAGCVSTVPVCLKFGACEIGFLGLKTETTLSLSNHREQARLLGRALSKLRSLPSLPLGVPPPPQLWRWPPPVEPPRLEIAAAAALLCQPGGKRSSTLPLDRYH